MRVVQVRLDAQEKHAGCCLHVFCLCEREAEQSEQLPEQELCLLARPFRLGDVEIVKIVAAQDEQQASRNCRRGLRHAVELRHRRLEPKIEPR